VSGLFKDCTHLTHPSRDPDTVKRWGECPLTTTEAIRYGVETLAFAGVDRDEAPGWLVTCEYFGDDDRQGAA
jgi:hypothetical protein